MVHSSYRFLADEKIELEAVLVSSLREAQFCFEYVNVFMCAQIIGQDKRRL